MIFKAKKNEVDQEKLQKKSKITLLASSNTVDPPACNTRKRKSIANDLNENLETASSKKKQKIVIFLET